MFGRQQNRNANVFTSEFRAWHDNSVKDLDISGRSGVIEFTAKEGRVLMPEWLMKQIGAGDNTLVRVTTTTLPLARDVKLEPQEVAFLDISNPGVVLETVFRNYPALTKGDIIRFNYADNSFHMKVLDIKPCNSQGAANFLNADVRVDFAPPVGYVEPQWKPTVVNQPKAPQAYEPEHDPLSPPTYDSSEEESDEKPKEVFTGQAQNLAGVNRTGSSALKNLNPKVQEKLVPIVNEKGTLIYKTEAEINDLRNSKTQILKQKEEESKEKEKELKRKREEDEAKKKTWGGNPQSLR